MPGHGQLTEAFDNFGVSLWFSPVGEIACDHAELCITLVFIDAGNRSIKTPMQVKIKKFLWPSDQMGIGKMDELHCKDLFDSLFISSCSGPVWDKSTI